MSLHSSLKTKSGALNQHRNLLTRTERIAKLMDQGNAARAVAVAARNSYSSEVHTVWLLHWRSEVAVAVVDSHCVDVHVVRAVQERSDVRVARTEMYCFGHFPKPWTGFSIESTVSL